jgi:hypothetical protein
LSNLLAAQSVQQTTPGGTGQDSDGDKGGVGGVRRSHGGEFRSFLDSVFQTLDQLGMVPPTDAAGASDAASASLTSKGGDSTGAVGASTDVRQAFHSFLHSLFQALRQADGSDQSDGGKGGNGTSAVGATGGYSNLGSNLESVLKAVSAGGDTELGSAFQNLAQSLAASGAAGSGQVSLQAFLQNLLQNLQGAGSNPVSTLGNVVNTKV